MQLSKPESAGHRMHFGADVAKDGQFQDVALNGFDTATGQNRLKVRYFATDGLSGTWREMDAEGLYTDAEDAPVHVVSVASDTHSPAADERLQIRRRFRAERLRALGRVDVEKPHLVAQA